MNGRYLLDTNAVIALVDGNLPIRELIARASEVFIPCPVLGELYFGAYRSDRVRENVAHVDDLIRWYAILRIDEFTAKAYGTLRQELSAAGQPIPNNDLWIAALAQQHGISIVSRDAHFDVVENLTVVRW